MGLKITGLEEYVRSLERVGDNAEEAEKRAVYKGAKIVADAIKAGLKTIPTAEGSIPGLPPYGTAANPINTISRQQKADLINGFGVAKIADKGNSVDTHVGFDGYGSVKTKKHPGGLPNVLLARAITSGSSFRIKNPIIRTSVNKARAKAREAMKKELEREIEKEMK